MKGFLAAAAILTAAYVGLQPNGAKAAEGAGGVVVGLLRRLLSADVAGLPNVSHASAAASSTPQAPGPFGGTGGVPLGPTGGPATSPAPVIA